ncbi:MAG: NADH:flavin oxidoreductase [Thermodesulfobacteriota bacterium]
MPDLFEPTFIRSMALANRFVRSATWEGMSDDQGRPTPKIAEFYTELALGGVGLIITGYAAVSPEGKQLPGTMVIAAEDFADDYRRLTAAVHAAGGRICLQLVHAGGQTDAKHAGRTPLAPTAVKLPQFPETPEELSKGEIDRIVRAFGAAARRAKAYGFDAVQLHAAHGYLISEFLSPLANRRSDGYGGSDENRARFLLEVYGEVRRQVGEDFPVLVKLNGCDFQEGGLSPAGALVAARLLDAAGIDAIEVSGGTPASGEKSPVRTKIDAPEKEAFHLELAMAIKGQVGCPVMCVGGFRSYETAELALARGIDYVSLARPLVREPALVNRWRTGDRRPATCISCNGCFRPGLREGGIYCVVERKEREKEKKE